MHCQNCGQSILQQGSKFCPFCGSSLTLGGKLNPSKQPAPANDVPGGWTASGVTLLSAAFLLVLISALLYYPYAAFGILLAGILPAALLGKIVLDNRCENCGRFFSMQCLQHDQIDGKKIYRMRGGSRQIVLLHVTWKDHLQCSHCNHQKDRVYTKDYDSFSE